MANNVDIKDFTLATARTMKTRESAGVNTPIHQLEDSAGNEILGVTTGAAVTTSAAGTIQQYLRGIVSLLVSGITVSSHAVTNAGTFAVQAAATLAAETTKNIGTVRMGDGTNTAAVKAASTAPLTTDPAVVVTISPNSQNSNGSTTDSLSTPVAWSTEGKAQLGSVTETAPASDAASSGLNGRLQRIAQNITTLIAATLKVAGDIAHGATDSGNPQKTGGRAVAGMSGVTLVTAAQRTDSLHGIDGAQYIRPHCGLEDISTGRATDTAGTSTSCIAAAGAGVKTYLTSIALCNSSATAVTVNVLDGASVKYTLSVPAGSGNNKEFTVPLPGTANTAWNFQSSAAATTITCSMIGFKSKV